MAFTRIRDDPDRIKKQLQESTGKTRYFMNVPGPGADLPYFTDPHMRLQRWGANLMTNATDLESELKGYNYRLNHDNLGSVPTKYSNAFTHATKRNYADVMPFIDETRATHPVFEYRERQTYFVEPRIIENNLPFGGYERDLPFETRLPTRMLEKDYHVSTPQHFPNLYNE